MNNKEIFIRLYQEYAKKYVNKILFSLFFSLLVAGSTASIAWLLDPAIKKIFIEKGSNIIISYSFGNYHSFYYKRIFSLSCKKDNDNCKY